MNDDIDYESMSGDELLDHTYGLRDQVKTLSQRRAELEYELAEDRAELRRHHTDFLKVQGLLSDAENVIRENPVALPEDEMTLDEVWAIIRSIRNIVG